MVAEIRNYSAKLNELKEKYAEALNLRDKTQTELNRHEQMTFAHQKRQELELFNMKRTLNFLRDQQVFTKTFTVRLCGIFPPSQLTYLNSAMITNLN